jgi:hypothetical protein
MKGSLQYVSKDKTLVKSWVVWYNDTPVGGNISFVDSLPLHPDDVKQIEKDSLVFNNIEARIKCYSDVEFEIIENKYARLTPYISDNFQIGPDGAFESDDEIKDQGDKYAEMMEDVSDRLGKHLVSAIFQDGANWQSSRRTFNSNKTK